LSLAVGTSSFTRTEYFLMLLWTVAKLYRELP